MSLIGEGKQSLYFDAEISADVLAHHSTPRNVTGVKSLSLQLVVEDLLVNRRIAAITNTDNVVSGTHTWVFANGAFVAGDVGGRIIVNGAVNAANNDSFTIASRVSATSITTGGIQVSETFPASTWPPSQLTAGGGLYIIPPGTLVGSWLIEASDDWVGPGQAAIWDMPTWGTEHWNDITAAFTGPGGTAVAAVVAAPSATRSQFVTAVGLTARAIRVTFTGTSGTGRAAAFISGGNYSER